MRVTATALPEVKMLEPDYFRDARGWFCETYSKRTLAQYGIHAEFVQDNHSLTLKKGTIRGIHFQAAPHPQGKLVRCVRGRIMDVAVDLRRASPTFKKWVCVELSAENHRQLWIPAGFGHAFITLEDGCEVEYKVDAFYDPACDRGIAWNDAEIGIDWGTDAPILSEKDAGAPPLSESDVDFALEGDLMSERTRIQVLKPKFHIEECLAQVRECLEIGWTGAGFKTVEFEKKWKAYTGHANACFLNSNSSGLHLAVNLLKRRYGWRDGDEIISTPITFVSTNHAILYERMCPCFADVDEYLCLDPEDVERKINEKTRAVIFVGYGGRVGRLDQIIAICRRHGLRLILDAAHMSGTRVNGVFPGTWEGVDAAVYSYQAVKNLPTGDSGMICFADAELDARCRKMSWMGINKDTYSRSDDKGTYKWDYNVEELGFKYNGNAIMAAIALAQLPYLDEENAYRRTLVRRYNEKLSGNPNVKIVGAPYPEECSFHVYEIMVPDREALLAKLAEEEIYCGVHYRDNTEYPMYACGRGSCPRAHEASKHIMTLPLHLYLTLEDVDRIAGVVNSVTA